MKLQFEKMTIVNFKTFRGEHEFVFPPVGLHFVRGVNFVHKRLGSNGAGKSSLWDALLWCLYGVTVQGLHNPDVQPWSGETPTAVELHLSKDGETHVIGRQARPNKLLMDDDPVNQEALDEFLGIGSAMIFTHTILMGQGRPLFFDLDRQRKMNLFVDVFDLDRWERRSENATLRVNKLQSMVDVRAALQQENVAQRREVSEQINALRDKSREWEQQQLQVLETVEQQLKQLNTQLEKYRDKKGRADQAYDSAMTELRAEEKRHEQLRDELALVRTNHARLLAKLINERGTLTRLKNELVELGEADVCPTCGQKIKGTRFGEHKRELARLIAHQEAVVKRGIDPIVEKRMQELEEQVRQSDKTIEKFRELATRSCDEVDYVLPLLADTEAKLRYLEKSQSDKQETINPYREQIAAQGRRWRDLKASHTERQEEINRLTRRQERVRYWIKGFKDLRLYIVEDILQELTLTTNSLLADCGLDGWEVQYHVERETKAGTLQRGLNVTVLSPLNDKAVRWEAWSGGEGQRLRVIGALALSETLLRHANVQCNLEIVDEPTAHLSAEGIGDMCELLADRAAQLHRTIIYADQQSVESARFASVIDVVKTEQGSSIKWT